MRSVRLTEGLEQEATEETEKNFPFHLERRVRSGRMHPVFHKASVGARSHTIAVKGIVFDLRYLTNYSGTG